MAGSVTRQVRAISLAVLGWNLLGDGLRDALDPRLTE
jgi:ABC-type dipeptide/oligopeptide/nickel transport system permease subunit